MEFGSLSRSASKKARNLRWIATVLGAVVAVSGCRSTSTGSDTVASPTTNLAAVTTVPATVPPATTPEFIPDTPSGTPFLDLNLVEKIDVFLEAPNSVFASNIAAEMGLSGDQRWSAWLLDLMRLGGSTETQMSTARALQDLTGIPATGDPVADFVAYGTWRRTAEVMPGTGYERWKTELYALVDEDYRTLLDGVDDDQVLSRILWGGVRRGGIPELNDAPRLAADEATFMTDDELVLGAVINGQPVAYPLRFMARHELANDHIDGVPVSLVYCTLCRSGILFDRRVEGEVLDFQTSGLLIDSNKLMVDRQTDTLWHHLTGTGISGPHKGVVLDRFPVATTTWGAWLTDHPASEVVDTPEPTYFPDTPERAPIAYDYTPGSAYSLYYENDNVWFPILEEPDTFERKELVVTIERGGVAVALGLDALRGSSPFVYRLGSEALVIVPHDGGARVYLHPDASVGHLQQVDVVDGGAGNEEATLADGRSAPRVVSGQAFWFAWWGIHPDTETWPAS